VYQWSSLVSPVKERKGKERKGKKRKGKERKGKERKGKAPFILRIVSKRSNMNYTVYPQITPYLPFYTG